MSEILYSDNLHFLISLFWFLQRYITLKFSMVITAAFMSCSLISAENYSWGLPSATTPKQQEW